MRPIIYLVLAVLMFFTWILFGENINVNIDLLGVVATSLAFFATAWAAHEARKSAKAALSAVKTADDTLTEAKRNYQRDIFEKRYSLLLEQHNHQLQNVYSYLSLGSEDSKSLIQKISNNQSVVHAVSYLNGHSIISPYMRTLYHLLKHINENFYSDDVEGDELIKKKKEYSSPLRSIIKNDVLYLIGVNCLVRKRIEKGVEIDNGYGYYQDMLNSFSFFEHAIFFDWSENIQYENVRRKMEDYLDNRYTAIIRNAFWRVIKGDKLNSNVFIRYPQVVPVVLGLGGIYSNPTSDIVEGFYKNVELITKGFLVEQFDGARATRSEILKKILRIKGMYIGESEYDINLDSLPVKAGDIVKMIINYRINNELKIRNVKPFFFSVQDKHCGYNSFSSSAIFAGVVEEAVREYVWYSRVISLSESKLRDSFFKDFLFEAKEFVREDEEKLCNLKRNA